VACRSTLLSLGRHIGEHGCDQAPKLLAGLLARRTFDRQATSAGKSRHPIGSPQPFGDVGRNIMRGPAIYTLHLGLHEHASLVYFPVQKSSRK
jgi:hypothetical protein